ncbi:MAG: hypothetical protein VYE40_10840 [Myxococcota bacterium]|nr:hypothetical protein [Myxococcota bacterium]
MKQISSYRAAFVGLALAMFMSGCTEKPALYCPAEVITDSSHESYGECCNSEQGLEGAACSEGSPCCGALVCSSSGVCTTGEVMEDMSPDLDDMPAPVDMPTPVDMPDMAKDMAKMPCDGACEGDTPVCDEASNTCVGCLDDTSCGGETPACDTTTNTCVGCIDESHCDGETPVCNTDTNSCVGCLGDEQCSGETSVCDVSKTTCVGCTENTTCTDANASLCQEDQTCGACEMDADCAHLGLNRCVEGVCNTCTTATEEQDCNGNACLPDGTCGTTPRETLGSCQACQADNECFADYRCVPMTFGDPAMPHGSFCLKVASTGCAQPYSILIDSPSVSGAASENYCGINQTNTTCEAIGSLRSNTTCSTDDECGAPGLEDGRCENLSLGLRCTISCTADSRCLQDQTCDIGEQYCR